MARKLSIPNGEHPGRWRVRDQLVHGQIQLEPNRFPRLELHPEVHATSGPVDTPFDQLVGTLYSNHEVLLGPGVVTEWFPGQMEGGATWALVGLGISAVGPRGWASAKLQLTGLEAIVPHPITSVQFPKEPKEPLRYSAEARFGSIKSKDAGVEVDCSYETSFPVGDRYRFLLHTYAVVTLRADEPMHVEAWVDSWLEPIRQLLSVSMGRSESIASVTLNSSLPDRDHPLSAQLFRPGITQEVVAAEQLKDSKGLPLVPLFRLDEAPPLAELLTRWRKFTNTHTAGQLYWLAADRRLTDSVRFLLLIQALESMHARDNEAAEAAADESHRAQRETARAELSGLEISEETQRFVSQFLARKPFIDLATRLRALLGEAPDSTTRVATWTHSTVDLDPALRALGKEPRDFAERLRDARNVLSHGHAELPSEPLGTAVNILDGLVRCRLLRYLAFTDEQVARAYGRALPAK